MSLINEGLNRPANFDGSIGAAQEARQKMNNEERRKFEQDRLKFEVESQDFPELISAMYIDSKQLSTAINNLMRSIFNDFFGTRLEITANHQLMASIFFSEDNAKKDGDRYNAIERIFTNKTLNNAEGRIEALNQFSAFGRRNLYRISKNGDELLRDVIPNQFINRETLKVDWSKVTNEGSMQTNGIYQNQIYVQVMIDITKVLKIMFGSKNKAGEEVQYAIQIGQPLNPTMTPLGEMKANEWQLLILRSNSDAVRNLASKLGYNFGNGSDLGIVTD